MEIYMHTGITRKDKKRTVFAIIRKQKKTLYFWLPINMNIYKTINF